MRRGLSLVALAAVVSLALASCSSQEPTVAVPSPVFTPAVASNLEAYYEQKVKWTDCGGATCAKVKVPLDYRNPAKGSTTLTVTKVPAKGDSQGALFVNPGGPGGSGFDYAKSARQSLSDAVNQHFDILGVDPRGVSKSDPVNCLTDRQQDALAAANSIPQTPAELSAIAKLAKTPGVGCVKFASPRFEYMSTENVARDFDIVRAVAKNESFNFLGKSYGTSIGARYAQLFPDRVGRMVLDGVLPVDLDLTAVTKGQALGFEEAFTHFSADCISHDDCPYRGNAKQVEVKIRNFLKSLNASPIKVGSRKLNSSLASSAVLSYLYFPARDYPKLRSALDDAVNSGNGAPLLALLDNRTGRKSDGRYADNSTSAFYSVTCLDRQYAGSLDEVSALAQQWQSVAPTFGSSLAWGMLACSNWPATGPAPTQKLTFEKTAPILVVATSRDPATPGVWAKRLAGQLPNSRLLTWAAYSHTAYHQGSGCIDDAVDRYLLAGALPAVNLKCSGN